MRISPRHGLTCQTSHQYNFQCEDYKVRFYCPNLHLKCSTSSFYPHHHRGTTNTTTTNSTTLQPPPKMNEKKAARKELRLNRKHLEQAEKNSLEKPRKRILKRRAKMRERAMRNMMMSTTQSVDVYQPRPTFLTYHPRHPLF